jgi:hypothetical protein
MDGAPRKEDKLKFTPVGILPAKWSISMSFSAVLRLGRVINAQFGILQRRLAWILFRAWEDEQRAGLAAASHQFAASPEMRPMA